MSSGVRGPPAQHMLDLSAHVLGEACMAPVAHLSSCHERSGSPWEVELGIVRYCATGGPGPQRGLFWEGMHSLQLPGNGGWSAGR